MYLVRFFVLMALAVPPGQGDDLKHSREALIHQTLVYTEQLRALLGIEEAARTRLTADLEKREALFSQGLVSRREVEESQERLRDSALRIAALEGQVRESEQLVAEVRLALEENLQGETETVVRFAGNSPWSLETVPRIQTFYQERFGRILPISAWGQTAIHDRFGLQHKGAVDVALHPDSPEGQGLMEYLREAGNPFIAFRAAVSGSSTGAHIHIGPPSQRTQTAFHVKAD
jgi:hypothetical protein